MCAELKAAGHEPAVRARTGLVLDPYFSATKIALDAGQRRRAARARRGAGELAFGTIDSFLIWRLSGGKTHATDVTNASRTLLFDICAAALGPRAVRAVRRAAARCCPRSARRRGGSRETRGVPGLPDGIPITGVAGDQQAALFGQDCTEPATRSAPTGRAPSC